MSILRLRDVRLLVGAVGLSAVGDAVLWILLAFHVGATAGSALAVSALFVCLWGPVVALGGVAGRIVDRHENRRLLIGVSLAQAAVVAAMAPAAGSLPVLLGLCVLLGAGVAVSSPAEFALLPAAAGEDRIAEANGHVEAARYLGMTAGPLLGGVLAAAGSTGSACCSTPRRSSRVAGAGARAARAARPAAVGRAAAAARAREGIGVLLAADRTLAIALAAAIGSLLFFTISVSAEVFFASDVLETGAAGFGVLMSAWTLGMVAGAVGLARLVPRRAARGRARSPASRSRAPGCSARPPARRWRSRCSASRVGGTAHGVKNVVLRTLIHERVPEELRGRAFAAYNAARNGAELGALGAGGVLVGVARRPGSRWRSPARSRSPSPCSRCCCSPAGTPPPPGGPHMPTKADPYAHRGDRRAAGALRRA